jgi:hypothetical protein
MTTLPLSSSVLQLRSWARHTLLLEGEIPNLPEAVDPLQAFAERSGLVERIGQDATQAILSKHFQGVIGGST